MGGTPGPTRIKTMTGVLQKTKNEYNSIHPNDKRWPCPFCLNKERTLIQCKVHIRKDHPNLINEQEMSSEYEKFVEMNSIPSKESNSATPKDLRDFLNLLNETNSKNYQDRNPEDSQKTNIFNLDYSEDDDDETFYCPYD